MTPQLREKLLALGQVHDEFVARQLSVTPFDPDSRPGSKDYNQHYVDLDGDDDAFHAAALAVIRR